MWIKQFIKISVLDNILCNITSNISLYKSLIFDYFNNILSNEVIDKLHDIINNQNISDDDRKMILGFAADSNHWKDIIINESEEIINSIKKQDDKIEELKKINEELNCSINELKEQNENYMLEYNNKITELSDKLTEQNIKTDELTIGVSKANKNAKKAELKTRKYLFIIKLTLFWVVAFVLFTSIFLLQKNIIKIENTLLKSAFEFIWFIISSFLTIKEIIGYFKDKKNILKKYDDLHK